jgi:hypothetical protein
MQSLQDTGIPSARELKKDMQYIEKWQYFNEAHRIRDRAVLFLRPPGHIAVASRETAAPEQLFFLPVRASASGDISSDPSASLFHETAVAASSSGASTSLEISARHYDPGDRVGDFFGHFYVIL